jgi:hypothetical protein
VLMTEEWARTFEERCLKPLGGLGGPLLFKKDDTPTYIISVNQ